MTKKLPVPQDAFAIDLYGFSGVRDADIKELSALKTATMLNLSHTVVGDAGLKELAALTDLEVLELKSTFATEAGIAELQKALPKCKITK